MQEKSGYFLRKKGIFVKEKQGISVTTGQFFAQKIKNCPKSYKHGEARFTLGVRADVRQRALRVSLWNIHGGTNMKLSTSSHIQRLFDESDVVALIEMHLFPDETPLHMPGFQCLHNPRPIFDMSSVRAVVKHSGGVAVFVNDSWLDCVSLWKQSTNGTRLWLQFQRLGAALLFLAIVYAPPKGSPYANEGLFDNIVVKVGMIQDLGGSILLIGDFNARTSVVDDYVDCRYFVEHMFDTLPLGNDFPEVLPKRHNSDKGGLKGWHNEFLDLCSSSGLFILNGRITGDESGECTCLANGGSSLVDYMVASPALFDCATSLVVHKCPLFCGKGGHSDHRPLSLNLQLPWQHVSPTISESRVDIRRFKYDASKCTQYCQHL